jgi:ArsR family transcriptional regulator, zinc-responsive transcriptional repressor
MACDLYKQLLMFAAVTDAQIPDAVAGAVGLFKALASTVRLAAMVELSAGPRCVHQLQTAFEAAGREVSQPLLSQHLRVLRSAGLVTTTRRGTEITYQLADVHVGPLVSAALRRAQGGSALPATARQLPDVARVTTSGGTSVATRSSATVRMAESATGTTISGQPNHA